MLQGLVIKSFGKTHYVKTSLGILKCSLKGALRIKGYRSSNLVAVGDRVSVEQENQGEGSIAEIFDRKNYIIRRSTNLSREVQIIAANIDLAILMVTLKEPTTSTVFIDRFLVSAEAYQIPVLLVFNKIDSCKGNDIEKLAEMMAAYDMAGYQLVSVSVTKRINIDKIREAVEGKTSVLCGLSGVGKSSLINVLDPSFCLPVSDISETHLSGKHTTSFAQMLELNFGAYIIDTPGIRGFGIVDIKKDELYHFFPEIFKFSKSCQFYNCLHLNEPGCAVLSAVADGNIAESRYRSYVSMYEDENKKFRKNKFL
ncbi:MAG: ribosome small subunit-dependent GTPase A [Bacteroidales bacterium]|nr:ribosome small subunit-dependent GTPase A [Bacteroidales bacterium]HOY37932.1 ribosome small subunit-dependent GTPase A [Bacteroidales bacterium]HQP03517.1 ribosome small subunit-dependent GTPase A [Bacteroidales bacterium]